MIGLEVHDATAVVSVDNPPVNMITAEVRHALDQALDDVKARSDVRALVLRCAGSTFFSGVDTGRINHA